MLDIEIQQPLVEQNFGPNLNHLFKPINMEENQLPREITMKEYVRLVISIATTSIQLDMATGNYELINIYFSCYLFFIDYLVKTLYLSLRNFIIQFKHSLLVYSTRTN